MQNVTSLKVNTLLLTIIPYLCFAQDDQYISAQVGNSMLNSKVGMTFDDLQSGTYSKHRLKNSLTYDLIAGRRVHNNIFGEIEYAYTQGYKLRFNDTERNTHDPITFSDKISTHNLFVNLNYQIKELKTAFTPYIIAGVGLSVNKLSGLKYNVPSVGLTESAKKSKQTNFAWQTGVGVLIPIKNKIDLNISYKYRDLGKAKSGVINNSNPIKSRISSSNFLIGISYKF